MPERGGGGGRKRNRRREREGEEEREKEEEGVREWEMMCLRSKLKMLSDKNIPTANHDIIDDFRATRWWR